MRKDMNELQGVWLGSPTQLRNLRKTYTEVGAAYYGSKEVLFEDGEDVLNNPRMMLFWLNDFANQFLDADNSASDIEDAQKLAKKCFRAVDRYKKYI